jgi:hypothetical protein
MDMPKKTDQKYLKILKCCAGKDEDQLDQTRAKRRSITQSQDEKEYPRYKTTKEG